MKKEIVSGQTCENNPSRDKHDFMPLRKEQGMSERISQAGNRALSHAAVEKDSFNSYPLGRLAQAGTIAAIEDEAHFQRSRASIIKNRERLSEGLTRLGFEALRSSANFVFTRHPDYQGDTLAAALRVRAILVRHFSNRGFRNICGSLSGPTRKQSAC
jgi:histidinol-phosphate/aromatic aminotransferase/cobyric acid decarboxylase-like protein